jgi:hypothetical protein
MLIEAGDIIGGPRYDSEHHSWEYEFWGKIDRRGWMLVVALHCSADFMHSPRVTYISVHQLNAKRAARKKVKDKGGHHNDKDLL